MRSSRAISARSGRGMTMHIEKIASIVMPMLRRLAKDVDEDMIEAATTLAILAGRVHPRDLEIDSATTSSTLDALEHANGLPSDSPRTTATPSRTIHHGAAGYATKIHVSDFARYAS